MASEDASEPHLPTALEGQELYTILRAAIEDAMMNVLGSLVLVVVGFLFAIAGAFLFITGLDPVGMYVGMVIILIGFYIVAVSLGAIRPVRQWF